ncbi:N-acetylmuramidase domain-containing protein [Oricola thermophila]|uniref:DUF3380 domain-containing protein n=1 Tax=Oricola thermophila TaxID=2742145 RepID=A0A6N1VHE3_9HYPH|nr:N-acetylmuramidase domain-containing protein [Oricola thermophila]QKV20310.1 DUF3380 domain-containing protein [Oricola thermophila]
MFSKEIISEIEAAARDVGAEPAALLAVIEVESGGRAFAEIDGRKEPLIRFEGHWFDRLLDGRKRARARALGLASPRAGVVRNPASQAERWRLLAEAMKVDRPAALQSTSWGMGQVMGFHWKALGYASIEELVAEARSGPAGQVRLMVRFMQANGLIDALKARDWAAFARAYNGPRYRVHRYDSRIAAAYRRHRRLLDSGRPGPAGLVRGDRGEAVRKLQRMLTAAGYPLAQDGQYGPETERAVRRFQADHGLDPSGSAGTRTMDELRRASRSGAFFRNLSYLYRLLRAMLPGAARKSDTWSGRLR